jgi:hypothetical protein
MSEKYSYSINDTLNNKVVPNKLTNEIEDSSITTPLSYILTNETLLELDIYFDSSLSGSEWTTLSGVVAAHDGITVATRSQDHVGGLPINISDIIDDRYGIRYNSSLSKWQPLEIPSWDELATTSGVLQSQIDGIDDEYVNESGDTMYGDLIMSNEARISLVDGTKAKPAFNFASASGTGWWLGPTGDLTSSVNGQEILGVMTTGQVIISNDTPNYETLVTMDNVIPNKKYVDDLVATVSGGGDVTAAANLADHAIIRGDGGAKGIQDSGWFIADDNTLTATFGTSGFMMSLQNSTASGEFIELKDSSGNKTMEFRSGGGGQAILNLYMSDGTTKYFEAAGGTVQIGRKPSTVDTDWEFIVDGSVTGHGVLFRVGENEGDIAFRIQDSDQSFLILDVHADNGQFVFGATYSGTMAANSKVYGVDIQHLDGDEIDFNTQVGTYRIAGVDIVMPTGGSAGQVLTKVDGTDYNTEWTTVGGSGAWSSAGGTTYLDTLSDGVAIGQTTTSGIFEARRKNAGQSNHIQALLTEGQLTELSNYNFNVYESDYCYFLVSAEDGSRRQAVVVAADSSAAGDKTVFGISTSNDSGASWDPQFVVTQDYGVGIKKNNPTEALDVVGNIAVTGNVDGRDVATDGSTLDTHTANSGIHFADAPSDGEQYARQDGDWTTVSGGETTVSKYVTTVSAWTLSGGNYYADVTHNLGTKDVLVEAYTTSDDKTVGLEDVDRTDTNTVRIWSNTNTEDVRVVVLSTNTGEAPGDHNIQSHTDTTATGAQLNELVGGGSTTLHSHGGNVDYGAILTVNGTYEGETITVTVDDASSAFGKVLAQASDFNYDLADADAATSSTGLVMALSSGSGSKSVLLRGQICDTSWNWSAGFLYLDTTAGSMTQTAPSGSSDQVVVLGWALSADTIFFAPSLVLVEVA